MSFQYSSSSNRFFGVGDRPRHGRVRWTECDHESSSVGSRRSLLSDHFSRKERQNESDFSPNSVIDQETRSAEGPPPSPSPICSPTTSSPALSPYNNGGRPAQSRCNGKPDSNNEGSIIPYNGAQSRGEKATASIVRGDPSSSRSDNASLNSHVLAGNLFSNRESKPTPENAEEDSDGALEIHVAEDRSRAAVRNQIHNGRRGHHRQHNWSDTSMGSFVSSDGESISLSREFDAVLQAAAAAGTSSQSMDSGRHSNGRTPTPQNHLPGIGEEEPSRSAGEEGDRNDDDVHSSSRRDAMALVPTSSSMDGPGEGTRERERGARDYLALVPIGVPESTGSNSDRDAPSNSSEAQNNERAIVESGNADGTINRGSRSSSTSLKQNTVPTPKQMALQKVKRDKIEAKAAAWQEAKTAKADNRFKREDTIIMAWENEQKVKANIKLKKVERKLEEKRAKAFEKMQNEIARAHRKAEDRRAVAEAKRAAEKANITEIADTIRSIGRLPRKFLLF